MSWRNNGVDAIQQHTTSYSGVWLRSLGSIYWDVLSAVFMWMVEKLPSEKSPRQDSAPPHFIRSQTQHHGFLFSRTLHDFCPGNVHLEVRCVRTCYQMRTMWSCCTASVQTFTQGLLGEGPRTGLRLLHDLRAEFRPAVRRVHREMWLRPDLSTSTRWNETSAGSAGGTGYLCKGY